MVIGDSLSYVSVVQWTTLAREARHQAQRCATNLYSVDP